MDIWWQEMSENQTLPCGVPPMEGHQEKIEYTEWYKNATERGCEVEKIMEFLRETEMFEEI